MPIQTPLGGILIRRWSAFTGWMRAAAQGFGHPWPVNNAAQVEIERVLAGLGGPPAPNQLQVRLAPDSAAVLCLFLLLQPEPSRVILTGDAGPLMGKLKAWVMITAQGAVPLLGSEALGFRGICLHMGAAGAALRLNLIFDGAGAIAGLQRPGGACDLRVEADAAGLACDLLLDAGATTPPVVPATGAGDFSPTAVALTYVQ